MVEQDHFTTQGMQEWGCLGRRVCLVWVNLCAGKCMQEEIHATRANTHYCASLTSLGAHHKLGWPMQSHVLPRYSLHKFSFQLNYLAYSNTLLFLKTRLLTSQHCNFINIFMFSSSVWFPVISVRSAAETSASNVLVWRPLPMSFIWHLSLGTVRACDRQLDKHLGVSVFNLLGILCQQQMHLICWFMELSGRRICCCSAAPHSCFGSLSCLVWVWISTRPHAGYWLYLRRILSLQVPKGWRLGAEVASHRLASQLWTCWCSTSEPLQSAKQLMCDSNPHRSAVHRLLSYIQSPQGETLLLRSSYNTAENIYTVRLSLWTSCIIFLLFLKLSSLWHMHRTTIALQQGCTKSSLPSTRFSSFFLLILFFF